MELIEVIEAAGWLDSFNEFYHTDFGFDPFSDILCYKNGSTIIIVVFNESWFIVNEVFVFGIIKENPFPLVLNELVDLNIELLRFHSEKGNNKYDSIMRMFNGKKYIDDKDPEKRMVYEISIKDNKKGIKRLYERHKTGLELIQKNKV